MRIAALNSASRIKNVRAQANHTATPANKRHSRVSGFEGWYNLLFLNEINDSVSPVMAPPASPMRDRQPASASTLILTNALATFADQIKPLAACPRLNAPGRRAYP